jgi:nucleoside-diphosphate-sugar epimerase
VGTSAPIVHVPGRPEDPRQRRPDISRIRARYGWEPRTSLADGLRLTLEAWQREDQERQMRAAPSAAPATGT